jgi:succinate dehydrogenase/fumarate reductase flavoprotein subunit
LEEQGRIVVVGAGRGMVAALVAAKRGVRIVPLEKAVEAAGNTVRSTGLTPPEVTDERAAEGRRLWVGFYLGSPSFRRSTA